MSQIVEEIPSGHPIQSSLQAIHARHDARSALSLLAGTLERATLRAAPDSPPLPLAGPLFLVHATAMWAGDGMQMMALVSWSEQGLPRMLAGQLDDAISAGVRVALPASAGRASTALPAAAAVPAPPADVPGDLPPWEAEPEPAPRNVRRAARAASTEAPDSAHVDLSAEMAALTPNPATTPAPSSTKAQPAASGGGWAAAVAASKPVSGSSRRGSRKPPTASDLGFDVDGDPDLRRGDVLLHPRFGRCKVIKASDDKVKVRRASGAFIDLHMKVCTFTRLPDEDGKRVFDVRIGRKR